MVCYAAPVTNLRYSDRDLVQRRIDLTLNIVLIIHFVYFWGSQEVAAIVIWPSILDTSILMNIFEIYLVWLVFLKSLEFDEYFWNFSRMINIYFAM